MLLMSSTTTMDITITKQFLYDDATEKTVEFKKGDYAILKARYNGNIVYLLSKVSDILPIMVPDQYAGCKFKGVRFILDMAGHFESMRISIDSDDILGAKIIDKDTAISLIPNWQVMDKSDDLLYKEEEEDKGDGEDSSNTDTPEAGNDEPTDSDAESGTNDKTDNEGNSNAGSDTSTEVDIPDKVTESVDENS